MTIILCEKQIKILSKLFELTESDAMVDLGFLHGNKVIGAFSCFSLEQNPKQYFQAC
jgi:hypothetical protein